MSATIHFEQRRLKGAETENPYNYKYSLSIRTGQKKKRTENRKNTMTDI